MVPVSLRRRLYSMRRASQLEHLKSREEVQNAHKRCWEVEILALGVLELVDMLFWRWVERKPVAAAAAAGDDTLHLLADRIESTGHTLAVAAGDGMTVGTAVRTWRMDRIPAVHSVGH